MNTIQIENILKDVNCFRGVYPADKLPNLVTKICRKYKNQPSCFISNTEGSYEPGEHWVAFYIPAFNSPGQHFCIEFFDSFGFHNKFSFVHSEYFLNFIRRIKKETHNNIINLKMNVDQLQDTSSALCGYYCIVYVFLRCQKNLNMDAVLKKLHTTSTKKRKKNYKLNDSNVLKIFNKHIRKGQQKDIQHGGTVYKNKPVQKCIAMNKCIHRHRQQQH